MGPSSTAGPWHQLHPTSPTWQQWRMVLDKDRHPQLGPHTRSRDPTPAAGTLRPPSHCSQQDTAPQEEMEGPTRGSGTGIGQLWRQLGDIAQENDRLRRSLREAERGVSQLQAELEQLQGDLSEQAQQCRREQLARREMAEETLAFTSYVRMLQYIRAWPGGGRGAVPGAAGDVLLPGGCQSCGYSPAPGQPLLPPGLRLLRPARTMSRSLCESTSSLRSALPLSSHAELQADASMLNAFSPAAPSPPARRAPAGASWAGRDLGRSAAGLGQQRSSASGTDTASSLSSSSDDGPPPGWGTKGPGPTPGSAEGPRHSARHGSRRKLPAFAPEGCERREEPAPPCPVYRLVLAGDGGTGKSSFLLRLCTNEFRADISSTLGVDFQIKQLLVDGEQTTLQIWDTAGQERYRSIARSYFRKAHGVLLLYDISSPSSFLSVRHWIEDIKATERPLPLMLVGNKMDLRPGLPEAAGVRTAHGQQLAMAHSSLFCETSAKDGTNVVEAVLHLARSQDRRPSAPSVLVPLQQPLEHGSPQATAETFWGRKRWWAPAAESPCACGERPLMQQKLDQTPSVPWEEDLSLKRWREQIPEGEVQELLP
ncbi:PREDICTED: ras and EF-hand domain-containing protein-like [Nipponia nippon]|nr:PREDICTED: ras and EF-hand domain-containing protein-like [Nipponia nippon]